MFKRLLIAVFALGLIMALGSTAVAEIGKGPIEEIQRIDPTNPRLNDLTSAVPAQPATKKPISAVGKVEPGSALPGTPLVNFCDMQDYTNGSAGYYWTIPDAYGDDLFNMRFTSDAGFDCSLKVAHYLLYWESAISGPKTFNSDMRCYLWDDDGFGFPGNKLDSVDIPFATLDAEHTAQGNLFFVSADFSAGNWVFSDGAEYHLGYTALNQATGSIAIISDVSGGPYDGEERSSENWGIWGSMLNDWGLDVSFFIWAERCCGEIPYSDCYTDAPIQSINYFWRAPHQTYCDEAYSMKFSVGAQDTLVSIDVAIYNDGASASSFDPAGNGTVTMSLYADDGTGLPGALMTSVSLPPAGYPFFPTLTSFPFNEVLPGAGDYHVAFSSDGVCGVTYESCMSSDGSDGVGASASDWGGGTWVDFLSGWGLDVNFYFLINICTDEYAICNADDAVSYFAYFWRLPDQYGDVAQAQKFNVVGVEECRLESVDLTLYWRKDENTATGFNKYEDDLDVSVYSDVAGAPGALLGTVTVGPADYNIAESTPTVSSIGNLHVDLLPLDIYTSSAYWVAFDVLPYSGYDTFRGIYTLTDDGLGTAISLGMAENWGDWTSAWGYMGPDWGLPDEIGLAMTSTTCCVPFPEHACDPGGDDDWSTNQSNYGRTGRSELPLGDSWCDLNVNWTVDHPTEGISFTGPTIFGEKVIQGYNSEFIVYDLLSGAVSYTITSPDLAWSSIRNSGTVEYIGFLGVDVLFVGCGSAQGIYAYDVATGGLLWKLNPSNGGPIAGQVRWGTFVVNDVAGTQVVYWGTDNGNVLAADAALGGLYAGWTTNPVALSYSTFKNTVSDGTNLYVGTYTTAGEGDVYSIDGATGAINWQLSAAGGLQGTTLWGAAYTDGEEGFQTMSYAGGNIYANSRAGGGYPVDGIMYSINAGSGNLNWYSQSNRGYYQSPIIDINRIYMPSLTGWVSPPGGGSVVVFNRGTGAIDFSMTSTSAGRYYADGFLTCEPNGVADQLFAFNEDGFLSCFNADDGLELWRRRIFYASGYAPNLGMSGALAPAADGDVHMVFASFWGGLIDFSKGDDRQRLQFESYNLVGPVEFGALPSLVVDLGPILTNTGCIDLNITAVTADEVPFTPDIPSFSYTNMDDNMMQRASTIANDLTSASTNKLGMRTRSIVSGDAFSVRDTEKELTNSAASGFPTFINGVVTPFAGQVVAPGEVVNFTVDVIQSAILRGPQSFYVEIGSDDPDFFINDGALLPQVYVSLVGGCLVDTITMEFGVGGANFQLVTNTGRLGTGDWTPHGFEIDGDGTSYYQGSFLQSMSHHRLAVHTQDLAGGGGEANALWSLQPDPNYCDGECKPALTTGVSLGAMTTDGGVSYTPILGNMVCASYLDSVQNTWSTSWDDWGQPFDNDSTMGLYTQQRTVGALDVPELANLTLAIMEITERNGNAITGWYLSSIHDYDVGADNAAHDQSISTGWSFNPGGDGAWGQIKIPFGACDGPGMINTHGLQGPMALYDWNGYFDSSYIFTTSAPGYYDHDMAGGDGEVHHTIAAHDFAGNETWTVAVATFGVDGLADNTVGTELAPTAILVNQWAGFGRGDVNNDAAINLADIIALAGYVNAGGPGPIPFMHLGDVNCDATVDIADVDVLIDYYFNCGACPCGDWVL